MNFLKPLADYIPGRRTMGHSREYEVQVYHGRTMELVREVMRDRNFNLPNDHPLMVALGHFHLVGDDLLSLYLAAVDVAGDIAGHLGWFGTTAPPRMLKKPYFYFEESVPEAIVYTNKQSSYRLVVDYILKRPDAKPWWEWQPVVVRYHPYTDMDYVPLSIRGGQYRVPAVTDGLTIVEVDLALLYLQYYLWRHDEISKIEGVPKPRGTFLLNYPLANAIESQMNMAFFNRMYCYTLGYQIYGNNKSPTWLSIRNGYYKIDDVIRLSLDKMRKMGGMSFTRMMTNLPSLTEGFDIAMTMKRGDITLVNSTMMLLSYNVLPVYEFWWKWVVDKQLQKFNRNEIAQIRYGLGLLYRNNVIVALSNRYAPFVLNRLKNFEESLKTSVK